MLSESQVVQLFLGVALAHMRASGDVTGMLPPSSI
jgi:hypothetical protein